MNIIITVKAYLEQLRQAYPDKDVPNQKELAEILGITKTHVYRILNNRTENVNRHVLARIIGHLRGCGFDCDVGDLLRFVE